MFGRGKRTRQEPVYEQPAGNPPSRTVHRSVQELCTLSYTETGNRQYQQDAVYVSGSRILASNKVTRVLGVVCDGMGGMADGGKASQTAIQMMIQGFRQIEKLPNVDIPAFFRQGIRAMDQTIHDFPTENGKGSGTTMVAVIVEDRKWYWASVGDSRIYFIRGKNMWQVTRDHNYWLRLQEMVAAGQITQEEAMGHRQKEALISFLGIGNVSLMDIGIQPGELQAGDTIMLCSDGITKTLSDDQIRRIITEDIVSMEEKAKTLVRAAVTNNTHSQDNTSVAVIQYRDVEMSRGTRK